MGFNSGFKGLSKNMLIIPQHAIAPSSIPSIWQSIRIIFGAKIIGFYYVFGIYEQRFNTNFHKLLVLYLRIQ